MFKNTSASSRERDPELLAGLDLGTSKITVVVAERHAEGASIIAIGQAPSQGIRKGMIVSLEQATKAIQLALADAENMAGSTITEAVVSFSSSELQCVRTPGMITLGGRNPRPVTEADIERVIESAQAPVQQSLPPDRMILHTMPVEFSLNGDSGIDEPLGMNGTRLDIDLLSVIVSSATVQNVRSCVDNAGLRVSGLVIKPLASALGTLTPEERDSGSVLVDLGGGTCGVAVFSNGHPMHLSVIPLGGDHITNDVASVLKIPINKAEELKKEVDLSSPDASALTEKLDIEHKGRSYQYSLAELTEIVKYRVDEIFAEFVQKEINASGEKMLSSGLIVTGGVSRSIGLPDYLSVKMNMPVRTANPLNNQTMPPLRNGAEFASAAGLIRYLLEQEREPFRYAGGTLSDGIRRPGRPQSTSRPKGDDLRDDEGGAPKKSIRSLFKGFLDDFF